MKNYRVKYRAVGLLSGKEPGEVIALDDFDAAHLLALGLIEEEGGEDAKPSKPASRQPAKR